MNSTSGCDGRPEEPAVSDDSGYMTGQMIHIDGGWVIQ